MMDGEPKYPKVTVNLVGEDGNAFNIMAIVRKAMFKAGCGADEIRAFQSECMEGDYDHLLQTCMKWVNVE
jgi:hypothetical protein